MRLLRSATQITGISRPVRLRYLAVFATVTALLIGGATLPAQAVEIDVENTIVTEVASNTRPGEPAGTLYSPKTVVYGEPITLSGSGWFLLDGSGGSAGPVFINQSSGSGQVRVKDRVIENQMLDSTYSDSRAHGVLQSDAEGAWSITIPFPTPDNSDLVEPWQIGETQSIRILTGTLIPGNRDHTRNPLVSFIVVGEDGEGAPEPGPADPPTWSHQTVTGGGATFWVEQSLSAGDATTLRLKGTGWKNAAGTQASTIAIKLNAGETKQYERSGDAVVSHPSAPGDSTIWTLLAPENPTEHANVLPIDENGDFDIVIDAPLGLTAGQYFTVRLQSGLFAAGDVQRTLTSDFLVVGGVAHIPEDEGELVTCVPSTSTPELRLRESGVPVGGSLHVSGTGWCHPGEGRGGSRIAIKLDEGAYSHLTSELHSNRTIWALVDADPYSGDWELDLRLPDGTASTSAPAFPEGSHTLRVLTGSLKNNDAERSLLSEPFVVGEYAPGSLPNPLDVDGGVLTGGNENGVAVQRSALEWSVSVPSAEPGDWVYIDTYAGSSSRAPFPRWYRLDSERRVLLSLAGTTLQAGELKLTVQSGNQGRIGELLGWVPITVSAPSVEAPLPPAPASPAGGGGSRISAVAPTAPASAPALPVKRSSQLTTSNVGQVTGVMDGNLVTLTVADGSPNQWIYAYVYTGVQTRPIGWVQLDAHRQLKVDISELPDGNHKIALVGVDGALIGWASAAKGQVLPARLSQEKPAELEEKNVADQSENPEPPVAAGVPPWLPDILLAGGALLLLGGAVTAALVIRKRKNLE